MASTWKICILTLAVLALGLLLRTSLFGNLAAMVTRENWFIPAESTVFAFRATVPEKGPGGWLYGEDGENCYYAGVSPYVLIPRQNDCPEFDPHDYRTWCEADIPAH